MSGTHRILVVDDVEQNRLLLGGMVKSLGYEVETARDGLEVFTKLPGGIDLVLLDVMMPGIDGFEVVRRIRADAALQDLPVIMVTALDSREDRVHSVESGASDFIAKPVDRSELRVRIDLQLRLKDAQDEIRRCRVDLAALAGAGSKEPDAHLDGVRSLLGALVSLTAGGPGRTAMTACDALDLLREGRGSRFDPQLFDLFAEVCGDTSNTHGSAPVAGAKPVK